MSSTAQLAVVAVVLSLWGCAHSPPRVADAAPAALQQPSEAQPSQAQRTARAAVVQVKGPEYGTGFLVTDLGHLVTAAHVVRDARHVQVRFADADPWLPATVVHTDTTSDLALLQLDAQAASDHGRHPLYLAAGAGCQGSAEVIMLSSADLIWQIGASRCSRT